MKHALFDKVLWPGERLPDEVVLGLDRFRSGGPLAQAWRRLGGSPTGSRDFVVALAATMQVEDHFEVLIARRDKGIAALLPLCRGAGFSARWRQPGAQEVYEACDGAYADDAAAAQIASLLAQDRRAAELHRLPAASPLIPALKAAMRGKGLVSLRPSLACPTIALDEKWHRPEQAFNAGRRSDFRRAARRAAAMGRVDYEIIAPDPDEFDALFDEALAVELASWKRAAGTAMAMDAGKESFFRAYFRHAAQEGTLRIAFMRIDNRPAAMQLALESDGRFWLFKIGFDEAYARCSPGALLMLHTLAYAARRGLAAYELLGGVEPWIAQLWTQDAHPMVHLRTYPYSRQGMVALAQDGLAWIKARLSQ
ncbi:MULTISPECIES: GNAT family N-acetyltransferase [unclassified Novosphingobium]|uniref:GNAT family N-acetyltransferase n=1 Tax=unclassified Novosphingobium TaxID=2644732 RepID=UPI00086A3523|nr:MULTISPECIES: GNAT family N-acetyltransferase [unclassified Novosphingobium]MBN9143403.1 GNAT family N-acetyltransferase [Novosphingobium sp.]MDR6706651.1 CelD/BcsL family acetyltransferase involved in cellulose biosynthesis [Novosphingobium sp. 1748]ODU83807.1 MAG: hypothetical protein ABT10_06100 [Novosphingobium sp. SCN 63-17]OJX92609.1 MAG: hypothetical protein BGP00_21820 [Novosphingobium sp. 63-713]